MALSCRGYCIDIVALQSFPRRRLGREQKRSGTVVHRQTTLALATKNHDDHTAFAAFLIGETHGRVSRASRGYRFTDRCLMF